MRTDNDLQFFVAEALQASANTNKETTVALGTDLADSMAIEIYKIVYDFGSYEWPTAGNNKTLRAGFSHKTGTDIGSGGEVEDDIVSMSEIVTYKETEGIWLEENFTTNKIDDMEDDPILYPFNRIYFIVDSAGYSAVKNARARVYYKTRKLNSKDYLELLEYWSSN